jgi:hypothetical protein
MNRPSLPPRPIGSALLVATVRAAQYHRNRVALAVPPRNVQPPRNYQTPALAALDCVALALGALAALASAAAVTVIAASIVGAL